LYSVLEVFFFIYGTLNLTVLHYITLPECDEQTDERTDRQTESL